MTRPGLVGIFNHVPAESPLDDGDRTHPSVCLRCLAPRGTRSSSFGQAPSVTFQPSGVVLRVAPSSRDAARPMELDPPAAGHLAPSRLLLQA
jgi:hypothetical protein